MSLFLPGNRWFVLTCLASFLVAGSIEAPAQPPKKRSAQARRQPRRPAGNAAGGPGALAPLPDATGMPGPPPGPPLAEPLGMPLSLLATDPAVARELGLTESQTAAVRQRVHRLNRELEQSVQRLADNPDGPAALDRAAALIERSRRQAEDQLGTLLGPTRFQRLQQIQRQLGGIAALVERPRSGGLELSAVQRSRFARSLADVDRQVEAFRRRKERETLEAVLTARQKQTLADLIGKPMEFTLDLPILPPTFRAPMPPPMAGGTGLASAATALPPETEPQNLEPIDGAGTR